MCVIIICFMLRGYIRWEKLSWKGAIILLITLPTWVLQTSSWFSPPEFCMCVYLQVNKNKTQAGASWVMNISGKRVSKLARLTSKPGVSHPTEEPTLSHPTSAFCIQQNSAWHSVGKQFLFLMKKKLPCFLFQKPVISKDKAKLTFACISI